MTSQIKNNDTIVFSGTKVCEIDQPAQTAPFRSSYVRRFSDMLIAHDPARKVNVVDKTSQDHTVITMMEFWHDDVLYHNPDILVVLVGEQDMYQHMWGHERFQPSNYEKIYSRLIKETKEKLPECRIILVEPYLSVIDENPYANGKHLDLLSKYREAVIKISEECSVDFIPAHQTITGLKKERNDTDLFGPNQVQLDMKGNILLAQMIADALGESPAKETILKEGETFLFIGDSITDCGRRDRPNGLGWGYARIFTDLQFAREPGKNITWINKGIGGNTIIDMKHRWQYDVIAQKPDRMSVKIGINDLNRSLCNGEPDINPELFEKTYDELLAWTIKEFPGIEILLISPFFMSQDKDPDSYRRKVLDYIQKYIAIGKKMSEKYKTRFIDTHAIFQKQLKYRDNSNFGNEPVHPAETGRMIIAEAMYSAFCK